MLEASDRSSKSDEELSTNLTPIAEKEIGLGSRNVSEQNPLLDVEAIEEKLHKFDSKDNTCKFQMSSQNAFQIFAHYHLP